MTSPVRITSDANPRIKQLVKLRTHRQRRKTGLFIAEGLREITRALDAGLICRELFTCPDLLGQSSSSRLGFDQAPANVDTFELAAKVFRKVAYVREPEGILAVFEQPRFALDGLATVGRKTLYLVAAGIEKPGNLGAMVRTADAAGCAAVLVADAVVDAFNPNAIRASTGAVFCMPVVAAPRADVVEHLARHGVRCLAARPDAALSYLEADWSRPLAVVIGPEDTGLDPAWDQAVAQTGGQNITIPMQSQSVDSLNASNAAAILLFRAAATA